MRHYVPLAGVIFSFAGLLGLMALPTSGIGQSNEQPMKVVAKERSRIDELDARIVQLEKLSIRIDVIGDDKVVFGEMIGNLNDDRMSRYWRLKMVLKSEPGDRKSVAEAVASKRPEMRDWMLKFMADETIESFSGSKNQSRIKEEIRKAFSEILSPTRKHIIKEVLFEDVMIQ